jgi:hypothetical protein
MHSDKLLKFIDMHKEIKAHPSVQLLIKKINDIAKTALTKTMEKFITGASDASDIKYTNYLILFACFGGNALKTVNKHVTISRMHFYTNAMSYSMAKSHTLPNRFINHGLKKPGSDEIAILPACVGKKIMLYFDIKDAETKF